MTRAEQPNLTLPDIARKAEAALKSDPVLGVVEDANLFRPHVVADVRRLFGETMANPDSHVTIHMAASLDGFIARTDGRVDWLETSDEFADGDTLDPGFVEAFLKTIDCYVMGSRTYETALSFEAKGFGWSYGDKPTFVLTSRELPRTRDTVEFHSGDLAQFVNGRLRPTFRSIWSVGGGMLSAECLRLGLADEVRYEVQIHLLQAK
jgi:dihydrofolate reductase